MGADHPVEKRGCWPSCGEKLWVLTTQNLINYEHRPPWIGNMATGPPSLT